jgi:hypothetical protein
MNSVEITDISGLTYPYNVYICNVYEQNCVLIATINTLVPAPVTLPLPTQFSSAPALGVKIITSDGCSRFNIEYC